MSTPGLLLDFLISTFPPVQLQRETKASGTSAKLDVSEERSTLLPTTAIPRIAPLAHRGWGLIFEPSANAVPPSAKKRASSEMSSAGVGLGNLCM